MKLRKISIGFIVALALTCFTLAPMTAYAAEEAVVAEQAEAIQEDELQEVSINLNKTKATVKKGKQLTLKATVSGEAGQEIVWKSSNKKVATVSKKGVVKAKAKGSAVITARIKGTQISAKCKVTVVNYVKMKMKTTGYCNCSKCAGKWAGGPTAIGTMPKQGRTIAVDRSLIPLGTKVKIGDTTYIAEDVGGGIRGNEIDVYYSNHKKAMSHGVKYQTVKVYL